MGGRQRVWVDGKERSVNAHEVDDENEGVRKRFDINDQFPIKGAEETAVEVNTNPQLTSLQAQGTMQPLP